MEELLLRCSLAFRGPCEGASERYSSHTGALQMAGGVGRASAQKSHPCLEKLREEGLQLLIVLHWLLQAADGGGRSFELGAPDAVDGARVL